MTTLPLWLVSEGGRDFAVVAAVSPRRALDIAGTRSESAQARRIGLADCASPRIVRLLCVDPVDRPDNPPGRRMLERAAAAAGVSMSEALDAGGRCAEAVAARWGVWAVMAERGFSMKESGRQLGGFDHTTVRYALAEIPARLAAGDTRLRNCIEAARSLAC